MIISKYLQKLQYTNKISQNFNLIKYWLFIYLGYLSINISLSIIELYIFIGIHINIGEH